MKPSFAAFILLLSPALARDFRPQAHLENIPLADSSIRQCYIFTTTAGVRYTVESSEDLSNWTTEDELYGLGNEYVVTMREFIPPPPPPPGTPPAVRPPPAKNVSVRLQRAAGTAGGAVVSWPSLDHGGPMVVAIAGTPATAWSGVPCYSERFGNHYFFVWYAGNIPVPPPSANPPLGPKDAAMLAELEASLPTMNQQVIDSVARARNAPAQPPAAPGAKKFWRIRVAPDVDTDADGSPDWAEFEIAARSIGSLVAGVVGDPFSVDTNGDGIPDGEQLDVDGDAVCDANDPDAGGQGNGQDGALVTWTRPVGFQFAAFQLPIPSPDPTLFLDDLSDNGSVLFTKVAGTSPASRLFVDRALQAPGFPYSLQPLGEPIGAFGSYAKALIGDQMLGNRIVEKAGFDDGVKEECLWDPVPVPNTYTFYEVHGYLDDILDDRPGFRVDRISVAPPATLKTQAGPLAGSQNAQGNVRFEENGNLVSAGTGNSAASYWRYNPQTSTYGNRIALPEPAIGRSATVVRQVPSSVPGQPPVTATWNLVPTLDGLLIAKDQDGFAESKVTCTPGQTNVGVSSQGWMATGQEIWSYDRWAPLNRYFGSLQLSSVAMREVLDTGLSIADLSIADYELGSISKTCLLFPISAEAVAPALTQPLGVDNISMMARGGPGRVPEIWIMAPNGGGSTSVVFRSPANPTSTLRLTSDDKVLFTPEILDSPLQTIQISGRKTATDDVNTQITRPSAGNALAIDFPIKVKAMKKRTVKVALHQVFGRDAQGAMTSPTWFPTKLDLEAYLNKVYGKQVNTFFDVTIFPEKGPNQNGIDFDLNHDLKLPLRPLNADRTAATPNAQVGPNSPYNIDVWVIGGGVMLTYNNDGFLDREAFGLTDHATGTVVVDGSLSVPAGKTRKVPAGKEAEFVLHVIAHEIGHVMTRDDHPGESQHKSGLVWDGGKDPFLRKRLMSAGEDTDHADPGSLLIKKEWDAIESWLRNEEIQGRITP